MKKWGIMLMMLFLTACGKPTFKGNYYVLSTSPADMPISILFSADEDQFGGEALNSYFGTYETDGSKITFSHLGSTKMMGPPKQMEEEMKYFEELSQVRSYRIADNYLVLILENGKELLFDKKEQPKQPQP